MVFYSLTSITTEWRRLLADLAMWSILSLVGGGMLYFAQFIIPIGTAHIFQVEFTIQSTSPALAFIHHLASSGLLMLTLLHELSTVNHRLDYYSMRQWLSEWFRESNWNSLALNNYFLSTLLTFFNLSDSGDDTVRLTHLCGKSHWEYRNCHIRSKTCSSNITNWP